MSDQVSACLRDAGISDSNQVARAIDLLMLLISKPRLEVRRPPAAIVCGDGVREAWA